MSEITQKWREAMGGRQDSGPVITRTFAGLPCRVRRLDITAWVRAGRIPEYLAVLFLEAKEGRREFNAEEMTGDEFRAALRFQREAVCSSMVEPRVADREEAEGDELLYRDFAAAFPAVCDELIQWQLSGAPEVPVETEGGDVALGDIASFRERPGKTAGASGDGQKLRRVGRQKVRAAG